MAAPTRDALNFPESDSQHIDPYIPPSPSHLPPSNDFEKPFVTLTFATSLDSQVAIAPGVQTALSGPQSKAMTHFLRSRHDAILVGVGTAIADNPSLNCRIQGVGGYGSEGLDGQPRPVIIDPQGRWNLISESKVMRLAREGRGKAPFIVTCAPPGSEKEKKLKDVGGKFLFTSPTSWSDKRRHIDWPRVLELLAAEGIKSVMIEGGGGVINSLLGDDVLFGRSGWQLIDSVIVTIAPTWLGQGGVQVCPSGKSPQIRLPTTRLRDIKWVPLGEDVILCGRPDTTIST